LLRLADLALAEGAEVPPALALPLYLRDKVAQTTAERAQAKALSAST
jgi:tRNA threonylcarbamoyladenosine biosynthesis protein TsaB